MLGLVLADNTCLIGDSLALGCERTLRLPDDGGVFPSPPGFGHLTLALDRGAERACPTLIVALRRCEAARLRLVHRAGPPLAVRAVAGERDVLADRGALARDGDLCIEQAGVAVVARRYFVAPAGRDDPPGPLRVLVYDGGRGDRLCAEVRVALVAAGHREPGGGARPPITAETYAHHGLPWFAHFAEEEGASARERPALPEERVRRVRRIFGRWLGGMP